MNTFAENRKIGQRRVNVGSNVSPVTLEQTILPATTHSQMVAQRVLKQALNQSPRVQSQIQLQQSLNQSPRMLAQANMAASIHRTQKAIPEQQTFQRQPISAQGGTIQRRIIVAKNLEANPDIIKLRENPLFQKLDKVPEGIYIKIGEGETAAIPITAFNKEDVEKHLVGAPKLPISYIVNIDPNTLSNQGTTIEESRFYRQLGRSRFNLQRDNDEPPPLISLDEMLTSPTDEEQSSSLLNLYERIPGLLDLDALRDPLGRGILSESRSSTTFGKKSLNTIVFEAISAFQSRQGKLSLYTTLLHELGHVEQNLNTPGAFRTVASEQLDEIRDIHIPRLPDNLVTRVTQASYLGTLNNPVWSELLDFKNATDKWLAVKRDVYKDSSRVDLAALAQSTIDLGDDLAPYVQIWLEYDVIANTEHPAAMERGEAIRHVHGVEATIGGPAAKRRALARRRLAQEQNLESPGLPKEVQERLDLENKLDKGPGERIISKLMLENDLSAPDSLPQLKLLMIRNAQNLTVDLVPMLTEYVKNFLTLVKTK